MARPVTLFTGQWADLSFDQVCAKAKSFGYDGVELACWGDHFEVDKALKDKNYCKGRWEILSDHGLKAFAISDHLVGQAVCDLIDERHKLILPPDVWGDGEPEGVRKRAAEEDDRHRQGVPQIHRRRAGQDRHFPRSSTASPARASGTASTPFRRPIRNTGRRVSTISPSAGRRS